MTDRAARRPRRQRENRIALLQVRCTPEERAQVEARAEAAGLSLSEFVRVSALHATVSSKADAVVVADLAGHAADLGRLGGLLKLWLSERRGDGAPAVRVDAVLGDIRQAVGHLAAAALRL